MTMFSFEVPLRHLQEFHDLQDYLFALSFLTKEEEYREYLQNRGDKMLVLDNSFNELQVAQSAQEMRQASLGLSPMYVISPDSDSWGTEEMIQSYNQMLEIGFTQDEIILPIRSSKEYLTAFQSRVRHMAIPYEYRPLFPEAFPWSSMHFLGLRDPLEIRMCRPLSCDTSMPVKVALKGWTLREWILKCCPHENTAPEFFSIEMTQEQIMLARANILELKEMCNERSSKLSKALPEGED
uniref:Uncharacterized protein n=1 Tax=viral metagenome TaxID=1070528 RepID=A0A6M3KFZ2_9ZZZZ